MKKIIQEGFLSKGKVNAAYVFSTAFLFGSSNKDNQGQSLSLAAERLNAANAGCCAAILSIH